ncbi:hypothetical protein CIHG_10501 [Coccidioides immitis H538.4]|uniref:Uncharacterized protein n=1 Tax=Coccidioides immitis H538.4 TaxID=396776 RepID=A0A0J8S5L5_COCIT|nr:hypothetical protein CIHG_10501 [Coccidioides immitis H538.4]
MHRTPTSEVDTKLWAEAPPGQILDDCWKINKRRLERLLCRTMQEVPGVKKYPESRGARRQKLPGGKSYPEVENTLRQKMPGVKSRTAANGLLKLALATV